MWLREFGLRPTVYGCVELCCIATLFVCGGVGVEAAPPRRPARMCLLGLPYLSSSGVRLRRQPPRPADADRHGAARSRAHPTHRTRPARHTNTHQHPGLTELPTWTPHTSSTTHTHILPERPPPGAPPHTHGAAQQLFLTEPPANNRFSTPIQTPRAAPHPRRRRERHRTTRTAMAAMHQQVTSTVLDANNDLPGAKRLTAASATPRGNLFKTPAGPAQTHRRDATATQ